MLQHKKQQYFENVNRSSITTTNKLLWKTVYPLFTEKNDSKNNKLTPVEGSKVLVNDAKITETFNSLFGYMVNTLNIEKDESIFCDAGAETDPSLCKLKKYSKHPSILRIKQYFKN